MTREEQVLIRGKVFLYKQKAPFVPSGKSVLGALEYREADDKVRCHECGEWFVSLAKHVSDKHQKGQADYKKTHGLNRWATLAGIKYTTNKSTVARALNLGKSLTPENRKKARSSAHEQMRKRRESGETSVRHELRNENGTCQAQILSTIKALASQIGRTPSRRELESVGVHIDSARRVLNVDSLQGLLALAGLAQRKRIGHRKYSRELLVELLREFYVKNKRLPTRSDMRSYGLLPVEATFKKEFGSLQHALTAAGFGLVAEEARAEKSVRRALRAAKNEQVTEERA